MFFSLIESNSDVISERNIAPVPMISKSDPKELFLAFKEIYRKDLSLVFSRKSSSSFNILGIDPSNLDLFPFDSFLMNFEDFEFS